MHAGIPGALTLEQARDAAVGMRVKVAEGSVPVTTRRREKKVARRAAGERANGTTFAEAERLSHASSVPTLFDLALFSRTPPSAVTLGHY